VDDEDMDDDAKALVPTEAPLPANDERQLPAQLLEQAKRYRIESRAASTRRAYQQQWGDFTGWCNANGRTPLPAEVDTLCAYLSWRADGKGTGKAPAISSLQQGIAAIRLAHETAGQACHVRHPVVREVWRGIRRYIASQRAVRQVDALMEDALRDIIDSLKPDILRDARDGAALALGWGGCRRVSEVVGLDWHNKGPSPGGRGFLAIDSYGVRMTLLTSKTSQDVSKEFLISRNDAPRLCAKVEEWIALAGITPGTPVLRPIVGKGAAKHVGSGRLSDRSVRNIVKRRVHLWGKRKGMGKQRIAALVAGFSSHSMRVGHITSAHDRGISTRQIMATSDHATERMVHHYTRIQEQSKNSSLRGSRL
jgi:integrase